MVKKAGEMISVITPVWNRSDLTYQFLAQNWLIYRSSPDVEWVIIDNGSADNTARVLSVFTATNGHKLTVIRNEQNEGFPIACNQGAKAAAGDVLVFINNDVEIKGDYLAVIEQALGANPAAIVGTELLTFDTGWNKFGGVIIPYIPGWCLACTRATFDDLGGFDERYSPCDYEDIDFSYTATVQGRDKLALALPLRHLSGQSGQQMTQRRWITERNRAKFAEKWGLEL